MNTKNNEVNFLKAKIHETNSGTILAACDKKHSNKTLAEGSIEFKIRESFYGKEEIGEQELINKMNEANSINLVGEKTVSIALKQGLAEEKHVRKISGIPHLQIYRV